MLPPGHDADDLAGAAASGERRGDGHRARALGDHAGALDEEPDGGGRLRHGDDERAGEKRASRAATSRGRRPCAPMPSTKLGV